MDAAEKKGYRQEFTIENYVIDFDTAQLNYPLPEGFHFVKHDKVDPVKHAICCWKGFDHEDKGPFENWEGEDLGTPWNPQKAYQGTISDIMAPPPHSTYEYNIIIANEREEYVCFRECGGCRKISSHIWSRFVRYPNIVIKVWRQRRFLCIIEE